VFTGVLNGSNGGCALVVVVVVVVMGRVGEVTKV
jgi:hypothetical protein